MQQNVKSWCHVKVISPFLKKEEKKFVCGK